MSTTLSTQDMVNMLLIRVPIGVDSNQCLSELNNAYAWINQKGSFVWSLSKSTLTIPTNQSSVLLPTDFDPGKATYLSGVLLGNADQYPVEIKNQPYDVAFRSQKFQTPPSPGMWSMWSYVITNTGQYQMWLFPKEAAPVAGPQTLAFVYHQIAPQLALSGSTYFPTPDQFDRAIVDLAEARIKYQYRMEGWDMAQKRGEGEVMSVIDLYRSTKKNMAGLADQGREAQETELARKSQ